MTAEQTWQEANKLYVNATTTKELEKAATLFLSLDSQCTDADISSVMIMFSIQAAARMSSANAKIENANKIMGVTDNIRTDELETKYNELIKIWNPEKYINDPDKYIRAEAKLKEIVDAYNTIKDSSYAVKNSLGTLEIHNNILEYSDTTFAVINGEGIDENDSADSSGRILQAFIGIILIVASIVIAFIHPAGIALIAPGLFYFGKSLTKQ